MFLRNTIDWARARLGLLRAAEETAEKAAEFMAAKAREYCPVDTGELRASIAVLKASGSATYHVVATAEHAIFVEYGSHHPSGLWIPPNPFMRRALAETAQAFPQIARSVRLDRPGGAAGAAHLGATFT